MSTPPSVRSRQIAAVLRNRIAHGDWPVGMRLPSTRNLAGEFSVSLSTVQCVLSELQSQNLIHCRPRVGGFVKASRPGAVEPPGTADTNRQIALIRYIPTPTAPLEEDSWAYRIISAVQETVEKSHYRLTLISYPRRADAVEVCLSKLVGTAGERPAGVISFATTELAPLMAKLDQKQIPWVTLNRLDSHAQHNFVTADNYEGGRRVGRCFAQLGFERILLMSGEMRKQSMVEKINGCVQGYLDLGMPLRGIEYCCEENTDDATGYKHLQRYLREQTHPPQAIFTTGDLLALGALRLCRQRGIRVPDDVAIVSSTGMLLAEHAHPSLTVLTQPMHEIGQNAAQMLLAMIHQGVSRVVGKFLPSQLVLRESLKVPQAMRQAIELDNRNCTHQTDDDREPAAALMPSHATP